MKALLFLLHRARKQSEQLQWGCQEATQGTEEGGSGFSSPAGNSCCFTANLLLSVLPPLCPRAFHTPSLKARLAVTLAVVGLLWGIKVIFTVPDQCWEASIPRSPDKNGEMSAGQCSCLES